MKQNYILYLVCLLAALALPTKAQNGTGADTKAAPSNPVMPYKVDTVPIGSHHGKVVVTATTPGKPADTYTDLLAGMAYNTATVKIAITPDTHYAIRTGYPKVYKTDDSKKTPITLKPLSEKDTTPTFTMPNAFVTIEVAYSELLNNIRLDTLKLAEKPAKLEDILPQLPKKLIAVFESGKTDSVSVVAATGWKLKTGTTFSADRGAINHFACTIALPDSVNQNKKELTGYMDVANPTFITEISTEAELCAFRDTVNAGRNYDGITVTLKNNISLTKPFTPISNNENKFFKGTFEGNGFTISNVNISVTENNRVYVGFFGCIDKGGTVQNLGVKGTAITAHSSAYTYAGGIAGNNSGIIRNCYTAIAITCTSDYNPRQAYAGGIAGCNSGTITNCYTTGSVTASRYAGGIQGDNGGTISHCFATGKVKAQYSSGIAGQATSLTNGIALNDSIITTLNYAYRIGEPGSSTNLSDNYASPAIPGTWADITKGHDKPDGADLTKSFATDGAGSGAFKNWTADNWDFGTPLSVNLPKLKTTGLATNKVIEEQTDIARSNFLLKPISINAATTYSNIAHKDRELIIEANGHLTVDSAAATITSLEIKEGGQVTTKQALAVTDTLRTSRTLNNLWSAFGSPIALTVKPVEAGEMLYSLTGYTTTDANKQNWNEADSVSPVAITANQAILLATNGANAEVSFCSNSSITVPVSKTITLGDALKDGEFIYQCNPALCNQTLKNVYLLSDDGARFELTANATVKPFQSFIVANKVTTAAIKSLRVSGDVPTSNTPVLTDSSFRVWGSNGQLHLDATTPADIAIYNLSGQLLHRFRFDGSRTLTLGQGIYLVRSNNITYKVSL